MKEERGTITVDKKVFSILATTIGKEIEGIVERNGIKVELHDDEVSFELGVVIKYGSVIHKVCEELQAQLSEQVEDYTGYKVKEVIIKVEDIEI